MSNEDKRIEEVTDSETKETVESGTKDLRILVTDVDKYGSDVTTMSNFSDGYIQQLTYELSANSVIDVMLIKPSCQ